jgi:hypothetical protein
MLVADWMPYLEVAGGALGEAVFVRFDLPADEVEALAQLADLGGHTFSVLTQEIKPFVLVAGSLPDELGIPADPGERHARGAEVGADLQPLEVLVAIDAVPVGPPAHGTGEYALALVEAQRVDTETSAFGNFSDAPARYEVTQWILQSKGLT